MNSYKEGGLEKRYIIHKIDGSEVSPEADYFVLRLDKDPHALVALKAYAESVKNDNIQLHDDLFDKIEKYKGEKK